MNTDTVTNQDNKTTCFKCGIELVAGSVYCHICGVKQDQADKPKKQKRDHGGGSYVYRNDREIWEYKVTLPDKTRKSFYGKTKKECREKYNSYSANPNKGDKEIIDILFEDWSEEWLTNYKKGKVEHQTYLGYRNAIHRHINPYFNRMKVTDVNPSHIEAFFASSGIAKLSDSKKNEFRVCLKGVFDTAVENGLRGSSPVMPKKRGTGKRKSKKKPQAYTPDQSAKIVTAAEKHRYGYCVLIPLYTGLRRGEMLALEWNCIDMDNRLITIKQSQAPTEETYRGIKGTKSNEERYIGINDALAAVLESMPRNGKYLFTCDGATMMSARAYHDRYGKVISAAEVDYLPPHKCRHTFASSVLRSGVDINTLKNMLGHSDITTTAVYLHADLSDVKNGVNGLSYKRSN